jgi:hypothetical protein
VSRIGNLIKIALSLPGTPHGLPSTKVYPDSPNYPRERIRESIANQLGVPAREVPDFMLLDRETRMEHARPIARANEQERYNQAYNQFELENTHRTIGPEDINTGNHFNLRRTLNIGGGLTTAAIVSMLTEALADRMYGAPTRHATARTNERVGR